MKFCMKCGAFMKLYTKYEVSLLLTHITMDYGNLHSTQPACQLLVMSLAGMLLVLTDATCISNCNHKM